MTDRQLLTVLAGPWGRPMPGDTHRPHCERFSYAAANEAYGSRRYEAYRLDQPVDELTVDGHRRSFTAKAALTPAKTKDRK